MRYEIILAPQAIRDLKRLSARERATVRDALETHLRMCDEPHWAAQVGRCAAWVECSDYYGVEHFLRLLGGMGSLNDVVLHREGRWLEAENDELQVLLARAYRLAGALRREPREPS